jgi:hypothetical protein
MEAFDLDGIVSLGILALFGGLLLWLPLGWLVARRYGFTAGVGSAMILFGLTGCGFGLWLAGLVFLHTSVATLARTACEAVAPDPMMTKPHERSREVFTLVQGGARWRLVTEPAWGPCRADRPEARLRYRSAALVPGAAEVAARIENDARQAPMLVGVFGAFGGFGLLGGLVLVLSAARDRGAIGREREDMPPLPAWRRRAGIAFTMAGNLGLVAAIVIMTFFEERVGGLVWGTHQLFRAAGIACACWIVAAALRRKLTIEGLLTFVIIGGGFWLAAASLEFMTGP